MNAERQPHALERVTGSVKDSSQASGLLQAVTCADEKGHVSSPVRADTRSIAARSRDRHRHRSGLCKTPAEHPAVDKIARSTNHQGWSSHRLPVWLRRLLTGPGQTRSGNPCVARRPEAWLGLSFQSM